MKQRVDSLLKLVGLSFGTVHLLASIILILYLSYVLGGKDFLQGVWGTDLRSAFAMAAWVDKYFPKVPFWYPIAGGGVSITHSYPFFSFILVSFFHRLFGASLIDTFALLGVLSVPAMAIGVYIFGSIKLKNQTAGLIAAVFYLVSPIAWTWLVGWGFYAEAVSHFFIAPIIIFWDLFYTEYFDNENGVKAGIFFLLTAIFLFLTTITHFGSGIGMLGFMAFYPLVHLLKKGGRMKNFIKGVLACLLVMIIATIFSALSILPYYSYTKNAAYGSLMGRASFEQVKEAALSPMGVLNFKKNIITRPDGPTYFTATRHISFPAIVSILAIAGIVFSILSLRFLPLGLFSAFSLFLTTNAQFEYFAIKYIPFPFNVPFDWRWSFVPLRVVLPVLAAYALCFPLNLLLFWAKGRILGFFRYLIASAGVCILGVFLLFKYGYLPAPEGLPFNYGAVGLDLRNIYNNKMELVTRTKHIEVDKDICVSNNTFKYLGDKTNQDAFVSQGMGAWCNSPIAAYFPAWSVSSWCDVEKQSAVGNVEDLPSLCSLPNQTTQSVEDFWNKCRNDSSYSNLCSLRYKSLEEQFMNFNWQNPLSYLKLKTADSYGQSGSFNGLIANINSENPVARVDYSPYLADLGMTGPYLNLDKRLSQLYIYTVSSSSLNQRFDNYRTSVFFIKNSPYGNNAEIIDNFTHWYGLNYIFVNDKADTNLLQSSGWAIWNKFENLGTVLKYPTENTLAEISNKPAVLVVGQNKYYAYDTVFLSSAYGILPYKDAYLVWGKDAIDDYSLSEISRFKTIILYSYAYKNKATADRLLESYVKAGGNLFIDTGIQYKTPDWQTKSNEVALKVLPAKTMAWTSVKKTDVYSSNQEIFTAGVDLTKLNPMVYGDTVWGISSFDSKDMRNWTKPILSIGKSPILTYGELGKGKIVWAGFNPFGHMKQNNGVNSDEMKLLSNIFSWLMTNNQPPQNTPVSYHRETPDKVIFNIQSEYPEGDFLLWKESYYPKFTASLLSGGKLTKIKDIYRAGPGLVLIRVSHLTKGDQIIYEYHKSLTEWISTGISGVTLLITFLVILEIMLLRKKSRILNNLTSWKNNLYSWSNKLHKNSKTWWNSDKEYE